MPDHSNLLGRLFPSVQRLFAPGETRRRSLWCYHVVEVMWAPKFCGAVDDKGQQKRAAIPRQRLTGQYIGIILGDARALQLKVWNDLYGIKSNETTCRDFALKNTSLIFEQEIPATI